VTDTIDVGSQVALAALLDTNCLEPGLTGTGLFDTGRFDTGQLDDGRWSGDGASELLASHPTVNRLVMAAVVSPGPRLRATVAGRPDLDAVLYPMLASDPEQAVRISVAANHSAPGAVVDHLTHDPTPEVRAAAVRELRRRAFPAAHAG
jgi:hypothetical protein